MAGASRQAERRFAAQRPMCSQLRLAAWRLGRTGQAHAVVDEPNEVLHEVHQSLHFLLRGWRLCFHIRFDNRLGLQARTTQCSFPSRRIVVRSRSQKPVRDELLSAFGPRDQHSATAILLSYPEIQD